MKFDGLARRSRAARPEAEDGREESPDLLGSFWPPNLGVVSLCGGPCFDNHQGGSRATPTTAGYKRSQNYEMAKTFGQNCARHSSVARNPAGVHLTFAGRANEK